MCGVTWLGGLHGVGGVTGSGASHSIMGVTWSDGCAHTVMRIHTHGGSHTGEGPAAWWGSTLCVGLTQHGGLHIPWGGHVVGGSWCLGGSHGMTGCHTAWGGGVRQWRGSHLGGSTYLASRPLSLPCLPSPSFRAATGPPIPAPLACVEAWGLGGGLGDPHCTPSSCPQNTVTGPPSWETNTAHGAASWHLPLPQPLPPSHAPRVPPAALLVPARLFAL